MLHWLRDLFAPRVHNGDGTAMYRRSRTDSDNAANYIFESFFGPALDPSLRGFVVGQGAGTGNGAPVAASVSFVLSNPIAGYEVGINPAQPVGLVRSPNSLIQQEQI
jgi:hypothetical protein